MKKLMENKLLYAVVLFALLLVLGWKADQNMYDFKVNGKTSANYEYIEESMENFATQYAANFAYKTRFVDLNGFGRRIIGQREINNVLKLNNEHLTLLEPMMTPAYNDFYAQTIMRYRDYCQENGASLICVIPAYKISKYDPQLPYGVSDMYNDMMDEFRGCLTDGGVEVMDLREEMHNDGIDQYDMYYKTDHHWTTEGAFYAYQKISRRISEMTGTEVDPKLLDLNNYSIDNYPKWHLGMHGQRTGSGFAGIDDFHLIRPKFETRIKKRDDGTVMSFDEALIRWDVFENSSAQNRYTYDNAYKANEINDLVCPDAKTDLSVLLLSDSFKEALAPWQLLTYRDYHTGSYHVLYASQIEEYHPDVVIIMAWPGYFYFNFEPDPNVPVGTYEE